MIYQQIKNQKMKTTFDTLKAAFNNGTGYDFFTKEGKYIAIDLKDEAQALELQAQGFTRLTATEVEAVFAEQTLPKFANSKSEEQN